jgi:hypothetical protein
MRHLTSRELDQQIRLKYEEESSEMVHRILWCCSSDTDVLNFVIVVHRKEREDHLTCRVKNEVLRGVNEEMSIT